MAVGPLSTAKIVSVFCLWGPLPTAAFFLAFNLYGLGFRGVLVWAVFLFYTYFCGLIPAALTGLIFALAMPRRGTPRSFIAESLTGASLGCMVGAASGWLVFGSSPDLIYPQPGPTRSSTTLQYSRFPG